jgi:homoserine kinase type II
MTLPDAREIGSHYGLDVASLEPLMAGSVNSNFCLTTVSGERLFLRVYEEKAASGASGELALVTQLASLGVSTPSPIECLTGGHTSSHRGKPVGVYPWVDGEILCTARVSPTVAHRLGEALATVHACTPALDRVPQGRFDVAGVVARLDGIDEASADFKADTTLIRERLDRYSAQAGPGLPAGLIHGDLFRDNVLWKDGRIAALIDFESASHGVFTYDLMVCVQAWCYTDRFELDRVRALLSGYESVRRLTPEERQALVVQGCLGALRFATTRITDFSLRTRAGQTPGRDYRRFLQRMHALEQGAIDSIIAETAT